ncbi:MAG TPA: DUF1592 domain-containing protein, partial [Pirellulales bacterium]|nr:DUF1592 domain-containing protein [Pirellulales bacterium]
MRGWTLISTAALALQVIAGNSRGSEPSRDELQARFGLTVRPFVESYCLACHSGDKPKGDFDLSVYTSVEAIANDERQWGRVLEKLKAGEMPPDEAKRQPPDDARQKIVTWIADLRRFQSTAASGDPGVVLARRLSNAEYNYTIRDLIGFDIQPAKEFPVDPANQAGFDNSGESLSVSPFLLKKQMEAARFVSEHLVLKPHGLGFAPHPVIAETDRDKYCVNRIIAFYKRQPMDLAEYFLAAWRFENRVKRASPSSPRPSPIEGEGETHRLAPAADNGELAAFAVDSKVSPKYLSIVYAALSKTREAIGPVAALQAMWRALPPPNAEHLVEARRGCERMRDWVIELRKKVRPEFANLNGPRMHNGSQWLVLWKDRQYANTRLTYSAGSALKLTPEELTEGADSVAAGPMTVPDDDAGRHEYEEAFKRFCAIVPDMFVVSERARVYLDPQKEKHLTGRLLNAGFHSQTGYFRDDGPLYELILSRAEQQELDELWQELDFVAGAIARQYAAMMWFERSDSSYMREPAFSFVRAEDKDAASEGKVERLRQAFLAKARAAGASDTVLDSIHDYFDEVNDRARWLEAAQLDAEPSHLAALVEFAERAYRRPLAQAERDDIVAFYRQLRSEDRLDHESAVRDTLVSILMSPHFCFRVNMAEPGRGVQPLSDYELASRLSYFLWSSMPDPPLLAHAAAGNLHKPEVLVAEVRRMLHDDRVRGLATEFGGNWLDFRRFEEWNAVDRDRFPQFTPALRQAMFEEPIQFFIDVAQRDGSVLDFLYGDYTFINPVLAKHYGMPAIDGPDDHWTRIDEAHRFDRGGLLPMAAFLTKNAPGLRTSPVKRGYWVVRRLLGEEIPPPPPNVPVLPADESKLGELTLPQMLARHRDNKSCAGC